jgi:hypothetical protein
VVAVASLLVPALVAVTAAFGIDAPCGSVTLPLIPPVNVDCANAIELSARIPKIIRGSRTNFDMENSLSMS